jgi:hypothetical protein
MSQQKQNGHFARFENNFADRDWVEHLRPTGESLISQPFYIQRHTKSSRSLYRVVKLFFSYALKGRAIMFLIHKFSPIIPLYPSFIPWIVNLVSVFH